MSGGSDARVDGGHSPADLVTEWDAGLRAEAEAEEQEVRRLLAALSRGELTPEAIMALCARRLEDLDEQVGELTAALQARTTRAETVGRDLARMREAEIMLNEFETGNGEYRIARLADANEATVREWMTTWGFSEEQILATLEREGPRMSSATDGFNIEDWRRITGNGELLRTTDFDEAISLLDGEMKRLNADNELLMIKLQSAMQQRTAMVQMTSNLLKALAEGVDAVVGNLR